MKPEQDPHYEDLVTIYRGTDIMEAKIVLSVLEGSNIPAYIPGKEWVNLLGGIQTTKQGIRVVVPQSFVDQAVQAIKDAREEGKTLTEE